MSVSNCSIDERGKARGGKAGDNNQKEWRIRSWYDYPWNCVLRSIDAEVAELIATMAEEAAKNDNVGYNQGDRMSFWNNLKQVGYRPEAITTPCAADCSSGVCSIIKGAGYRLNNTALKSLTASSYTGNMRARLKAIGFGVLTDTKYLTSDKFLKRGDILLKEGEHTCINLTDGENAQELIAKYIINVAAEVIRKGDTGASVEALQLLLNGYGYTLEVDGDFGAKTLKAVKAYQQKNSLEVDGIVGENTWRALLGTDGD